VNHVPRHPLFALATPLALGLFVAVSLGVGYLYFKESARNNTLTTELEAARAEHSGLSAENQARIISLEASLASTTEILRQSEEARETYKARLEDKEDEVDALAKQVKKISGTVGVLDKLAKTDPELLMKYSKVYFLNEHYTPAKISKIESEYAAVQTEQYLESRVYDRLTDMIDEAAEDDVVIKVRSAYRSFEAQKNLKSAYSVSYGTGANTFSADQGYSEHQLGTTVDLTSPENGNQLAGFDTTQAFAWLQKNAHKYGFTLSYPKGNAYYIYEPWHFRYVGEDLASDLQEDGKFFYDLDQREIDKYLVSVFE
jgi:D-alanyl-D-alanine carboxypeptidase